MKKKDPDVRFCIESNNINVLNYSSILTLCACCRQSELTILKIWESSVRSLFLNNCTPDTLSARESA